MARIDDDDLPDGERVFVTGALRRAKRAEDCLDAAGADYVVKVEPLGRSFLLGTLRMGAVFYVASTDAGRCREQLAAAGLADGVIDVQE